MLPYLEVLGGCNTTVNTVEAFNYRNSRCIVPTQKQGREHYNGNIIA